MERVVEIFAAQDESTDSRSHLVDRYGGEVYRFCRSLTYSKDDADDLFQEVFLKVMARPEKISSAASPKGFLFSTTIYIWKSWKRKYARRERIAPILPISEEMTIGQSLEDEVLSGLDAKAVRAVVAGLPEKFRLCVLLYYAHDQSLSEIGAVIGLPVGTVKSRLYKARKLIEKGLMVAGYEN